MKHMSSCCIDSPDMLTTANRGMCRSYKNSCSLSTVCDSIWCAKDLDLDMKLALAKGAHAALMRQIEADAALLARMHVMDYSLLLGVHYPKWGQDVWYPPHTPHKVRPPAILPPHCTTPQAA